MEKINQEIVNDGKPYYGDIPKDEIEKYASVFGEGSKELTDLLRYCFQNDIKTLACCKGHEDRKECDPYIVFLPDEELSMYLCELIDKMPIESIIVDKHKDYLRTAIFLYNDKAFSYLQNHLHAYVNLKEQGGYYNPKYNYTEDAVNDALSGDNDEYVVTIKDGRIIKQRRENLFAEPVNVLNESYCPNREITSSLLSRVAMSLNNTLKKGK